MSLRAPIACALLCATAAVTLSSPGPAEAGRRSKAAKLHRSAIPKGKRWFCLATETAGMPAAVCKRTAEECSAKLEEVTETVHRMALQYGADLSVTVTMDCTETDPVWVFTYFDSAEKEWGAVVTPTKTSCGEVIPDPAWTRMSTCTRVRAR